MDPEAVQSDFTVVNQGDDPLSVQVDFTVVDLEGGGGPGPGPSGARRRPVIVACGD